MTCSPIIPRWKRIAGTLAILALPVSLAACATVDVPPIEPADQSALDVRIDADGTVHIPAFSVPPSSFLTAEGRQYLADHLKAMQDPASTALPDDGVPFFMRPYLAYARATYDLQRESITIAGVKGYSYLLSQGIAPGKEKKILLNLHGGGFAGCYPGCAELESMPIAALGGYKVITIDYRQAPAHKFPAASEDVAAVYRELLKSYRPEDIGMYGCSAGGMLVGMALAWFDREGLPMPGAAGIFCAGMTLTDGPGFGGDSQFLAAPIGEGYTPVRNVNDRLPALEYLSEVDPLDPMAAPANSLELLAKFPPTLFLTGTRAFDFSSAVYSHGQMVKAGAKADLHLWDGLFHGFFYNPEVPESRESYRVIVDHFDRHLGAPRSR